MKSKVTVEASWLNQLLPDKVQLLAHVAPDKAKALEVLLDAALREAWQNGARHPAERQGQHVEV